MKQALFCTFVIAQFGIFPSTHAADPVVVSVIDGEEIQQLSLQLNGPPPIGGESDLIMNLFSQNDVDCPPERKKISKTIWKCGNGKLIRVEDEAFASILDQAWK